MVKLNGTEFVLEPLSKATATAMTPPKLREWDHIFISLDAEGKRFHLRLKALEPCKKCIFPFRETGIGTVTVNAIREDCPTCKGSGWQEMLYKYPSYRAEDFFLRIPEATWLGARAGGPRFEWLAACTDFTVLLIDQCWPSERIHFRADAQGTEESDSRLVFDALKVRFIAQSRRAADVAAFKINGELPKLPKNWLEHYEHKPAPYQTAAACFVSKTSGAIFADPGTGKTFIAQQAVNVLSNVEQNGNGTKRVLVICPPQVCYNWFLEIQRFAATAGKVVIMRGSKHKRVKALIEGVKLEKDCTFTVVIASYDSAKRDVDELSLIPWDYCFADESHYFKDPRSKRFELMEALRDASKVRVPLTGSPIGNSLLDLWTQLEFVEEGGSGFHDYAAFRKYHGVFEEVSGSARGIEKLVAVQNIAMIQERLTRMAFTISKEEAGLNLPDKVYDVWQVEMTKSQAKMYERIKEELIIEIEDKLSKRSDKMTIEHVLTSLLRLAQVTSGFVTWDAIADPDTGLVYKEKRVEQISSHNPKADALIEILCDPERDPLGKTIVWGCFREDMRYISERLTAKGIGHVTYYGDTKQNQRDANIAKFNKDTECRVFLGNPQAAGSGLDLLGYDKLDPDNSHTYANHVIFYSQNWSSLLRVQAEDRAHRRGTRMPVRITDLVVLDTIDQEIRERVQSKIDNAGLVLEIGDVLRNVLGSTLGVAI